MKHSVFDTYTYRNAHPRAYLISLARERMCLSKAEVAKMVGLSEHIVDLLERRYEHVTEGVFWHYIMADLISEEEASAAMFGLPSVPSSRDVYFRAKDALERNGVSGERASILIGQ